MKGVDWLWMNVANLINFGKAHLRSAGGKILDITFLVLPLAGPGWVRVAETNRYTKIAPDFGSSTKRTRGSILSICDFLCNAEDGPKDKSASFFRRVFAR